MELPFPVSRPMTGHTVPGKARLFRVKIVSYPDLTVDSKLGAARQVQPIKAMHMNQDLTPENQKMMKLMAMMQGKHPDSVAKQAIPQMHPGYSRVKEDLTWRGVTAQSSVFFST